MIVSGIHVPVALALDASASLYVANQGSNTVTVYAPKSAKILPTISNGLASPVALAFSPSTITDGVARPDFMSFSP
ncbi:MAG TPA: hypothetical protein VGK84_03220 [Candidatus Tumulicola sp.]